MAAEPIAFADTFPKLLLIHAVQRGSRPAMCARQHGQSRIWTWGEVLEEVRAFALGLARLDVRRDDRIAIIGANRPRLYWAIAAAQSIGAVPVPVYPDVAADELGAVLAHSGAKIAVVAGEEQIEKLLSVSERLPSLGTIVHDGPLTRRDRAPARLMRFEEVQRAGREAGVRPSAPTWEREIGKGKGSDVAVILYTSGAADGPRGVMLTHGGLIATARSANAFDRINEKEIVVAALPMAWIGDHLASYAQSFLAGYCVACAESPRTVFADLRGSGATYLLAPLNYYENLCLLAINQFEGAGGARRGAFHFFLQVAARWGAKILNWERVPGPAWLLYQLGDLLLYRSLRNRFGFGRIRVAYAAGGEAEAEIIRFFRSLGVNLKPLYGQTEASLWISAQPDGEIYGDTVGRPLPGVEIRIADHGEVLVRSPGVFAGYYRDPETTAEIRTSEGWLHTGAVGLVDSRTGHLKITGRIATGVDRDAETLLAAKHVESLFKSHPLL